MRPTEAGQRVRCIAIHEGARDLRGKLGTVTKYEPSPDGHPHFLIHVRMDDTGIEWAEFVGNFEVVDEQSAISDIHTSDHACAHIEYKRRYDEIKELTKCPEALSAVAHVRAILGAVAAVERERDEARAELDNAVGRWESLDEKYIRDISAAQSRNAELEAALRETLIPLKAMHLADGHNWSRAVREQFAKAEPMALAALSPSPAQPATVVDGCTWKCFKCGKENEVCEHLRAAARETTTFVKPISRTVRREVEFDDGNDYAPASDLAAPFESSDSKESAGSESPSGRSAGAPTLLTATGKPCHCGHPYKALCEKNAGYSSNRNRIEAPECRHEGCTYQGWSGHMDQDGNFECGPCWTKRIDAAREGK